MRRVQMTIVCAVFFVAAITGGAACAQTAAATTAYPNMAPVEQYMMPRAEEIALARSAGPEAISQDASVMVMGRRGYEIAEKGSNGFVCIVERSWTKPSNDPDFWNPKIRGPLCLNPAAVRTYLPLTLKKTELILAGGSKADMLAAIKTGLDTKELPALEPGAMCYMLSKQGYLSEPGGHWHPHVMFFVPVTDDAAWGANLAGSPMIAAQDPEDRLTILMILVRKWSDGTADQ
jgi:hypothetical protein